MSLMKSIIPKYLLSITIIITIFAYFAEYKPLNDFINYVIGSVIIITAFALPLGGVNLIVREWNNIKKRKGEWYLSIWMLVCMAVMSLTGILFGTSQPIYSWLYNNVNMPSGSTIYAITAFFIASAAYKAFRGRNIDAILLLVTAAITMLMNAPIGELIWAPVVPIGKWLSDYAQNTGFRVINIGWAIGLIGLCIRYVFWRERVTGD